jgi:hypothetical protein
VKGAVESGEELVGKGSECGVRELGGGCYLLVCVVAIASEPGFVPCVDSGREVPRLSERVVTEVGVVEFWPGFDVIWAFVVVCVLVLLGRDLEFLLEGFEIEYGFLFG